MIESRLQGPGPLENNYALRFSSPASGNPPEEALTATTQRQRPSRAATNALILLVPGSLIRTTSGSEMGNSSALPVALSIAGSDSGGGAGIQADLKTFQSFGVFGTTAITAITAQDTMGVRGVHPVPHAMVRAQIDAVAEDFRPSAFKTGMLATAELVRVVATAIQDHRMKRYVLDPVMVSSTGMRLLDEGAVESVLELLLPLSALVTPNLEETRILTGLAVEGEDGQREAAHRLVRMGAGAALVKGGHSPGTEIADLFWDGSAERVWRRVKIPTRNTHGTGCTLSAAVVAGLAQGAKLENAIDDALVYVERAIRTAPGLGAGVGPVNHLAEVPR